MKLRSITAGLATGALFVASAWAGIGLTPVGVEDAPRAADAATSKAGAPRVTAQIGEGVTLGADELLVGAAKVDLFPTPDATKGEIWERDKRKCTPQGSGDPNAALTHAADPRTPWIENTNCIYMGGFGVGPTQPVVEWDNYEPARPVVDPVSGAVNLRGYGLWSRSAAFVRNGKAVVLTLIDAEGYFAAYNRLCPPEKGCGITDLQQQLAAETGLDPASFVFASTHAHSAMDLIGGWGAVPVWYMRQVAEAMRESVRDALAAANLQPAVLEAGEVFARGLNSERRDTYRSAEDPSLNYIRAIGRDGSTITTVGTFAAHATSFGGSATLAHADWPGVFAKRVEERFGGVGIVFEAGLGNMSSRGGHAMGYSLAQLLPAVGTMSESAYTPVAGGGQVVKVPNVRVKQEFWDQPVTNIPLGSLGAAGFFDRTFGGPATMDTGKTSGKSCRSAGAYSVRTSVTAAKIGEVVVTAAPGEIFSNFSNTIEERSSITALAIGQANDALGYLPQSFETDHVARQGSGFVQPQANGGHLVEYEDAYSIDACFGDKALETQIKLLGTL